MMRGILRSGSDSSRGSTNSSDVGSVYSVPYTPPATPPRRPSNGSERFEAARLSPRTQALPSFQKRRAQGGIKRVAFDSRPLALPPPISDPAAWGAMDGAQISPLLPESRASDVVHQSLQLPHGATFVGECDKQTATGAGCIRYANGDCYEGDVADGVAHGFGIYTCASDNTSFRGRFEAGRQTKGMQTLGDGYTFDGCYNANAAMGEGVLFDDKGFVLRASFVDGQAHGLGHVRYRSGDSFLGEFNYGGLKAGPGVVRYPDGRVGVRYVQHGVAYVMLVAHHAESVFVQQLVLQEQALAHEAWTALCQVRDEMLLLAQRESCAEFSGAHWSLLPWQPNATQIQALSGILSAIGDNPGATQKAMRNLLRGLLHMLGPARPYMTVGEMEGATSYSPTMSYPNMLAFVTNTVLPHFGTSQLLLGQAPLAHDCMLDFGYRLDGELGFAQRLESSVTAVSVALSAAYTLDQARGDNDLSHSRTVLCSVLDGTRRFDTRLHAMRHALTMIGLCDALVPVAPGAPPTGQSPIQKPPLVVAAHERGLSQVRLRARQGAAIQLRPRVRSASVGSHSGLEEACRLSPMIEVADGPHPRAPV